MANVCRVRERKEVNKHEHELNINATSKHDLVCESVRLRLFPLSCVAVNRRWSTTVSAVALFTCREWAGGQAVDNSKTVHIIQVWCQSLYGHSCSLRMNCNHFSDLPAFPIAPSSEQSLSCKGRWMRFLPNVEGDELFSSCHIHVQFNSVSECAGVWG